MLIIINNKKDIVKAIVSNKSRNNLNNNSSIIKNIKTGTKHGLERCIEKVSALYSTRLILNLIFIFNQS